MKKEKATPMNISILGKEFQVASPESEHSKLLEAAQFLDARMNEIRGNGKVLGIERIAVMAALNLSYELINSPSFDSEGAEKLSQRLDSLDLRLDSALKNSEQMKLTDS